MAKNYRLDGINSSVEFGEEGPNFDADPAGTFFQVRNPDDTDYINLKLANAVDPEDAVTKSQLDAMTVGQIMKVNVDFQWNTPSPFNIGSPVPANSTIIRAYLNISSAFDGTNPEINIGDALVTNRIIATENIREDTLNVYICDLWHVYTSQTQIIGTLSMPGATQGEASVAVIYF